MTSTTAYIIWMIAGMIACVDSSSRLIDISDIYRSAVNRQSEGFGVDILADNIPNIVLQVVVFSSGCVEVQEHGYREQDCKIADLDVFSLENSNEKLQLFIRISDFKNTSVGYL